MFSHVVDDFYQGAVLALLPYYASRGHYGYVAMAGLSLAATASSAITQPIFGIIADRRRTGWMAGAGMVLAATGVAASGATNRYPLICLAVSLAGLGVAAYHPEATWQARSVAGGSHAVMGYYHVGGNLGIALAPVVVVPVVNAAGFGGLWPLAVPAWVTAAALLIRGIGPAARAVPPRGAGQASDKRAFAFLTGIVILRSIVYYGLATFLVLYVERSLHGGRGAGEAALATLLFGGVCGTVLGGHLAGRLGRLRTLRIAYGLAAPTLVLVLVMRGPALFPALLAAGVFLYVPFSIHTTLGQDYLPRLIGTAAGVTTGLTVSAGGVLAPALGALAAATGLRTMLTVLAVLPLLALLLAVPLSDPDARAATGAAAAAAAGIHPRSRAPE